MFLFLLDICLSVGLLGHMLTLPSAFWGTVKNCFLQFYIPTISIWGRVQISPYRVKLCQNLLCLSFFIMAILMGRKWYFIVALIFTSLMTSFGERLFMCLWVICTYFWGTFVHVLWILCPFLIGLSFYYRIVRILYIFWV